MNEVSVNSPRPRAGHLSIRSLLHAPVIVFVAALAVYLAVPCERASDDNYDSQLTAYSIATGHWGRLETLRPYLASLALQHRATVLGSNSGALIAGRGFGVALALAPFYVLARSCGLPPEVVLSDRFNQLFAATWTALAVALFFATVQRLRDPPCVWFSTAAFAFGSSLLSILSREVWQHTLLVLLSAVAVWLLTAPASTGRRWRIAVAGFTMGWAVAARPTGVLVAAPLAWVAWRQDRRQRAMLLGALVPWAVVTAAYNWVEFGSPLLFGQTLIGASKFGTAEGRVFGLTPLASLAGALFSPGRGFFVFSPVFVLAVALLPLLLRRFRRREHGQNDPTGSSLRPLLNPALVAVLLNLAAVAAWKQWAGGWTYGPRYLSDALVFWGLLLAFGLHQARTFAARLRRLVWMCASVTLVVSVANHAAGLLVNPYDPSSHSATVQPDEHPERLWRWSEYPPLYNLRVWAKRVGRRGTAAPLAPK
jgi:hypothetical protein